MKNYEIVNLNNDKVCRSIVFAVNYCNPFDDIKEIESELHRSGILRGSSILFDLLLTNGDSSNRFVEAEFDGENLRNIRITSRVCDTLKINIADFFEKNKKRFLASPVLNNSQKFFLRKRMYV